MTTDDVKEYHRKMQDLRAERDRLSLNGKECDWCEKPAVTKWREGQGTGHSETVFACETHRELEF